MLKIGKSQANWEKLVTLAPCPEAGAQMEKKHVKEEIDRVENNNLFI